MSSSVNSTATFVGQQIFIYAGIPVLIAGVIGGILNIIVFLSLKTFRQNTCALFLTIMSFVNIGQLLTSLFSRILITGFMIDWTETSLFYCKFRSYCLQVCTLTSYTCICLATVDQFLVTSLRLRWQQVFTIKRAYFACLLFFVIWLLHGIPSIVWYNHILSPTTGKTSCSITHPIYQKYINYSYTLILTGISPILITGLFGSLAYWNVRQTLYRAVLLVRRELDKQLTSMVLVQAVYNFFAILPYVVVLFLANTLDLTSASVNYTAFSCANFTTGMIYYLYFAVSIIISDYAFEFCFVLESILYLCLCIETVS
jgi:hypothetical protein